MQTKRSLFLSLIAVLCWCGIAAAQQSTGGIAGRVLKGTKGVGGVTILVNETKAVQISDSAGKFEFRRMPVGSYTVIFTLGDHVESRTDVRVEAEKTTQLDVNVDWEIGLSETLTVYSASRRIEKIVDAPSAVSVVPAEQIEREASHGQLPKVLEFTPGAEITQSGLYDFNFNTRGFNSSVNRRVAVYVDGRDTAAPFLGAQEWAALSSPLDDLANVEFVRGPSAALYGANSSAGVVNMTSKAPRDSEGGTVRVTAGELSTDNIDMRWAGSLGKDWYVKTVGGLRETGDFTIPRNVDVEYARPCSSEELLDPSLRDTPCLPREQIPLLRTSNDIFSGSVRFDKYVSDSSLISLEGGYADIEGPVFQTGIGRIQILESNRPWARIAHSRPHWNVLAYFSRREAQQKSLQSQADLWTDTKKYSIEFQTNWDLGGGKGRVVAGAAHIEEDIDTLDPNTGQQSLILEPVKADRQAVFGQFDWRFNDHFKAVFAGRVDDSTLHDTQFSPKAALVFSVNPQHTLRLTYNEAFQVANYSEFFLNAEVTQTNAFRFLEGVCTDVGVVCGLESIPVYAVGRSDLDLEETQSYELGYSAILANKAFLTVDYYTAKNEQFITDLLPQVGTPLGPWINAGCTGPGLPRACCTGSGTGTCQPLNPNVSSWTAPAEWNDIEVAPDLSLAQALRNALNFLAPGAGVQASNAPDGSTIVVARSYTNFGQVDTQGVDLGLNYYFSDALNLQFTYSWFDFEPDESAFPALCFSDPPPRIPCEDLLLPNTPEHKFSVGLNYRRDRWNVGISGRWVDDFLWSAGIFEGPVADNRPNTNRAQPYSTVDLRGGFRIDENWRLGVNVANVFDNENYQAFGGDILGRRALANLQYDW